MVEIEELELIIQNLLDKLNKSEIVLDEIRTWDKILQFNLKDNNIFYILNSGQDLEYVRGKADNPDCTLSMIPELAKELFSGQIDLFDAILTRKIKIKGDPSHFMKLTVLYEYFD